MIHHYKNKKGFTLAEVLITLGIIGVVAAMTIPALIHKYNNMVVETRLKKFYSIMNQAILMAEANYGDRRVWFENGYNWDTSVDAAQKKRMWLEKYLMPYLKIVKTKTLPGNVTRLYFEDGSVAEHSSNGLSSWYFYPKNPEKCTAKSYYDIAGRCVFFFYYNPNEFNDKKNLERFNFEPYDYDWDKTKDSLINHPQYGCRLNSPTNSYCTKLIQYNNWTIPKDYPFKL